MPYSFLTAAAVFILGLIIGSFLNAVIYRLHSRESIVKGRSKCPNCQHALGVSDLVPVLSFIFLQGKCRYCGQKISWQYPLVELATGLLFVVAYLVEINNFQFSIFNFQFSILLLRDFIVVSSLVVIFVSDWLYLTIPDEVAVPAIVVIFVLNLLVGPSWSSMLIALIIGGGFFALQYILSRGAWIGGGDLRLGVLMGIILGWPLILAALFFSYIFGAIAALFLLAFKKVTPKTQIPFGIFLAPMTVAVLFFGNNLVSWYLNLL